MKKENSVLKGTIFKTVIICVLAVALTFGSVFLSSVLNAMRLKNAFVKTVNEFGNNLNLKTQSLILPSVKSGDSFTINAKTNLTSKNTADISASYKPRPKRISAQAIFRSAKGDSADLYAYCNSVFAGISLCGNDTTFYTIPASIFKNVTGSLLSGALLNIDKNLSVQNIKAVISNVKSKKSPGISKDVIIKEGLKLFSKIEWDKNTNLNLFKKNPTYKFKVSQKSITQFLKSILSQNLTGYEYADTIIKNYAEKLLANSSSGEYHFSIKINDDRVENIKITIFEVLKNNYELEFDIQNSKSEIKVTLINTDSENNIFSFGMLKSEKGLSVNFYNDQNQSFKIDINTSTHKTEFDADIKINTQNSIKAQGSFQKSDCMLKLSVLKAQKQPKNLYLRLSKDYNEYCRVEKSKGLAKAKITELMTLGCKLKTLKKAIGI